MRNRKKIFAAEVEILQCGKFSFQVHQEAGLCGSDPNFVEHKGCFFLKNFSNVAAALKPDTT